MTRYWIQRCRTCGREVSFATEGARHPARAPRGLCRGCGATTRHDVERYPDGWQLKPEEG